MKTVLNERALQEVKAARDKPADLVDECLDRWEIETLAEVSGQASAIVFCTSGVQVLFGRPVVQKLGSFRSRRFQMRMFACPSFCLSACLLSAHLYAGS